MSPRQDDADCSRPHGGAAPEVDAVAAARRSRRADVVIPLCGIAWAMWALVPWVPGIFARAPSDGAFTIFSHIAFAQGEPWGTTTLHTSGPLGFLRFAYFYRPTYALLLLGNAAVAAVVALLLDHLTRRHLALWARLPFVCGAMWMLSLSDDAVWLLPFLAVQLLLPEVSRSRRWSLRPDTAWLAWPLLLALGVCALAANVKGSFLLMAAILAAELAVLELRGRRAPVVSASFVLLIVALARWAGLRLGDWGPYATHILQSPSGYAESFSQAGSPAQAGILISVALAFLTLEGLRAWRSPDRFASLVRWSAVGILVWMTAKGGLVRQDWVHQMRPIASLGVYFAVQFVARGRELGVRNRLAHGVLLLGLSGLFVATQGERLAKQGQRPSLLAARFEGFVSFLTKGSAVAAARDARARREVAAQIRSPWAPQGSVGVFGSRQSLLLGHSGQQVMLPIVAPYEIWSPWTSRREREFLLGPQAPDYLLYTQSPTSAELALTLAARYEEVERRPHYWLLRRRPVPLNVRKRIVLESSVDAGGRIEIPEAWRNAPAVVEVRYRKTLANTLISALYQPPEAFLVLFDNSTAVAKIRMNSLLSAEGIVLSGAPGIWDAKPETVHGARFGPLAQERVDATALGFEAKGVAGNEWGRYFHPVIDIRVYVPDFG